MASGLVKPGQARFRRISHKIVAGRWTAAWQLRRATAPGRTTPSAVSVTATRLALARVDAPWGMQIPPARFGGVRRSVRRRPAHS
jgi:hypothetical protein